MTNVGKETVSTGEGADLASAAAGGGGDLAVAEGSGGDKGDGRKSGGKRGSKTAADYLKMGYTERQVAWLAPDPEKPKRFLPRLSRKEKAMYNAREVAQDFIQEIMRFPMLPQDKPLYNLRDVLPEMYKVESESFDALEAAVKRNPKATPEDLAKVLGISLPPLPKPPRPGAEAILEWDLKVVLVPAVVQQDHPANKKAKCRVHIRALQRETGLSDLALQYIAEIAEHRYDESTGILKLTSEKYSTMDENRREILAMLKKLIDEGKRFDADRKVAKDSKVIKWATDAKASENISNHVP